MRSSSKHSAFCLQIIFCNAEEVQQRERTLQKKGRVERSKGQREVELAPPDSRVKQEVCSRKALAHEALWVV